MRITRDNYEAFLLDRLEGVINEEDNRELELFFLSNPDLVPEPLEELHVLEVEPISMDGKESLKRHLPPRGAQKDQLDDLLVGKLEGDLSEEQCRTVDRWIAEDEEIALAWRIMQATKVSAIPAIYPDKSSLKKENRRIIALWRPLAVAASIALLLGIGWWIQQPQGSSTGPVATTQIEDNEPEKVESLQPSNPIVGETEVPAEATTPMRNDVPSEDPAHEHETPQGEPRIIKVEPSPRTSVDRIAAIKSKVTRDLALEPRSVPQPDMTVAFSDAPEDYGSFEEKSLTVPELIAGVFRKQVLAEEEPSTGTLGRDDALAMVDRGLKGAFDQGSGLIIDSRKKTSGRKRYGLTLGDVGISASLGN